MKTGKLIRLDLAEKISTRCGISLQKAHLVIEGFIDTVEQAIKKNDYLEIRGFGKFLPRHSKAKEVSYNPCTKCAISIKASTSVKFKPFKELKEMVNS